MSYEFKTGLKIPDVKSWRLVADLDRARIRMTRVARNKGEKVMPSLDGGVLSYDPRMLREKEELADKLTEMCPATIDSAGFGGPNGVVSDFYALRNVAGYLMTPMTVPPMDNGGLVKELGLAPGFLSQRHERIFVDLHRAMFRAMEEAPLSVRKAASSGFPHFQTDLVAKKAEIFNMLHSAPEILTKFHNGELERLYTDHGLFFATYIGVRLQPDKVVKGSDGRFMAKPREINDEAYARGLANGTRSTAKKEVYLPGRLDPLNGHFALRRRTVYGYPSSYNYWLTSFFTLWRAVYLNRYAFTWKHRGADDIKEKLSKFAYVVGADVKQFDQSVGWWILDRFVSEFNDILKEEVVEFFRKVLQQPVFQPHPNVGGGFEFNPCFGDPFDLNTFTLKPGLPSGIGPNPDIGKFIMTWVYLCVLDDYFKDVLESGVDVILRGDHPRYGLLDMGDDAVLCSNDEGFIAWFAEFVKKEDQPYYVKLEPENGISFLGNVIYRDHSDRLQVAPNPVTFLVNWLVPERGIDSPLRQFYATGWFERKKHYARSPSFDTVWSTWEDVHRKHFGSGLDGPFIQALREERRPSTIGLSYADRLALEDPSVIHYKVDVNELAPWVRDSIVSTIPAADFVPYIERFFR